METFDELISSPEPVLVDFHAEWCAPCQTMVKVLKKIKDLQGEAMHVIKVDIDKNPSVASHFFIQTIPTLILFKNGKQVWRQSGVIDPVNLNKIINMLNNLPLFYLFPVIICQSNHPLDKVIGFRPTEITVLTYRILIKFLIAFQKHIVCHMMLPDRAAPAIFL